ncbi:MAG: hypothetical protein NVS4B3_03260 [Gemmatimonadaceae bacterium]
MQRFTLAMLSALISPLVLGCRDPRSITGSDPGPGRVVASASHDDNERRERENDCDEELSAQLSSKTEVPSTTSAADGHVSVELEHGGRIEWTVRIANPAHEPFKAGHIHMGMPMAIGPVVQTLFSNSAGDVSNPLIIRGSATNPEVAAGLREHPENFYVNFHTAKFPGGAVRGQLARDDDDEDEHCSGVVPPVPPPVGPPTLF